MADHLSIEATARRSLRGWGGAGIVVAVSGGSDSVGLLRVLHRLAPERDLRLSVAHLDHGVRGATAESDARFVAELAEFLGLPFDHGRWSPTRPGHFEADARRARYDWLLEVARSRKASVVAVGHTRDDQAETILHRILRGTGPRGLVGMSSRRVLAEGVTLLRPLLRTSRQEVRAYLAALGQEYRNDATNADTTRTRARLRHDLIPKLAAEYNPRIVEALVRLGQLAGGTERALRGRLRGLRRTATIEAGPDRLLFDRRALAKLPGFVRAEVLRLAWRHQGWPEVAMSASRWERLARLAKSRRGRFSVGGGFEAIAAPDVLELRRERGCG